MLIFKKSLKSVISFALAVSMLVCSLAFTINAIDSTEAEEPVVNTIPVFLLNEEGEVITTLSACDHYTGYTSIWDTSVDNYHNRASNGSWCIASTIMICDLCKFVAWYDTGRYYAPCPNATRADYHG